MSALTAERPYDLPEDPDMTCAPALESTPETDLFADVDEAIEAADALGETVAGRHPSLDSLCGRLHAIIVGQAAADLLAAAEEDPETIPARAGVWAPPSWAWVFSRVHVGRKERAADGSRLRLPVRAEWSSGSIVLVEDGPAASHDWTAAGLGVTGLGTTSVGASETLLDPVADQSAMGLPETVTVPVLTRREILTHLRGLVEAGATARWEALAYLEPYMRRALVLAHANVSNELSVTWGTRLAVLDDTKLETIASQMLLGDESHPGKVTQMLERCLRPDTFRKVEPLKYIKESLRRDANTEVRRAIGDPHIGTKIRKVALELGLRDLDAIIEEYRDRYPNDRLSKDRAMAALSVAPDAMASWSELRAHDVG